jgi:hypothetical protein
MPHSLPPLRLTDPEESNLAQSRRVVAQAVAGLIFGLLSPLVLFEPAFCFAPVLGVIFGVWALRRIRRGDSSLTGRKGALLGIALSLLFGAGAMTDRLVSREMARAEAEPVGEAWLRHLLENQPQKAHQLTLPPSSRAPRDDRLWNVYRNDPALRADLEASVAGRLARTLLALGPRAYVRFYQAADHIHDEDGNYVTLYYAVTYEDAGEKKSFFVQLALLRTNDVADRGEWRVIGSEGGVKPAGWK